MTQGRWPEAPRGPRNGTEGPVGRAALPCDPRRMGLALKQRWHVVWPGSSSPRGPGRWGWWWALGPRSLCPPQEAEAAGRRMARTSSSPEAAPLGLPPLPHLTLALLGSGPGLWPRRQGGSLCSAHQAAPLPPHPPPVHLSTFLLGARPLVPLPVASLAPQTLGGLCCAPVRPPPWESEG